MKKTKIIKNKQGVVETISSDITNKTDNDLNKKLNVDKKSNTKEKNKKTNKSKKCKKHFSFPLFSSFIVIFSLVFAFTAFILVTKEKANTVSLGHYTDSTYDSERIRLNDALKIHTNDTYYVFIYKDDCSGCSTVESTILQYIKSGPRPLYLLDGDLYKKQLLEVDTKTGNYKENYAVKDISELKVPRYPCLLLVQKGEVVAHCLTSNTIKNQLKLR